jgi:hypothetical protein
MELPNDHQLDNYSTQIIEITPELAEEWLRRNEGNRKIRPDRVDRYAGQMRGGDWLVSPDAIAFDTSGRLINGQHRLKAITQLGDGRSASCIVATGLDPDAFKIADVGVKRTGADVLRIEGFSRNAEELAAVSRLIALWHQGRLEESDQYENVHNSVIVEIATRCGERLQETIEKVNQHKQSLSGQMPRSLMAFAHFAYKPTFPERTGMFYNGFTGTGEFRQVDWEKEYGVEGAESPITQLQNRMRSHYDGYNRKRKLGFLIKAMNYYCLEKPQKRLRYRVSDNFPEIAASMVPELREKSTSEMDLG